MTRSTSGYRVPVSEVRARRPVTLSVHVDVLLPPGAFPGGAPTECRTYADLGSASENLFAGGCGVVVEDDSPTWAERLSAAAGGSYANEAGDGETDHRGHNPRVVWNAVLDRAADVIGAGHVDPLRPKTLSDHHVDYFKRVYVKHLTDDDIAAFLEEFRFRALQQAVAQGLIDPHAPYTPNNLDPATFVRFDGKVMNSATRNTTPYWIDPDGVRHPRRHDTQSAWHAEAGSDTDNAWGPKFVGLSARQPWYLGRVVLDVRPETPGLAGQTGEAAVALRMVRDLLARTLDGTPDGPTAGVRGLTADGVLRGTHVDELMDAGIAVVSPSHAKSNKNRDTEGRYGPNRVEQSCALYVEDFANADGTTCQHTIWGEGGHLKVEHDAGHVNGKLELHPCLSPSLVNNRQNKKSIWYVDVLVPCGRHDGAAPHKHRVRLGRNDRTGDLNLSEYVRQVPHGHPAYDDRYGTRNDTESFNNQLEHAFYSDRLPVYDARLQTLVMTLAAHAYNSRGRACHLQREREQHLAMVA